MLIFLEPVRFSEKEIDDVCEQGLRLGRKNN